jgi:hypothetical protein
VLVILIQNLFQKSQVALRNQTVLLLICPIRLKVKEQLYHLELPEILVDLVNPEDLADPAQVIRIALPDSQADPEDLTDRVDLDLQVLLLIRKLI